MLLLHLCVGITGTTPDPNSVNNFQKHVIPRKFDYSTFNNKQVCTRLNQDEFNRAQSCNILVDDPLDNPCSSCCKFDQKCTYESNRKQRKLNEPAKLNAPIKNTRPERLKLTIQNHRLQNKELQEEINKMKLCIEIIASLWTVNLIKISFHYSVLVIMRIFHHL